MANLICPKCRGEMATYERNGISVDQCTDCRGIFLDRGELDHLINAENAWAAAPAQAPATPAPPPPPVQAPQQHYSQPQHGYQQQGYPQGYQQKYYEPKYDKKKKKRNFLEDLFD